jgi:ABC-type nitrate/sulfonate/bicarbonate transport system permease component
MTSSSSRLHRRLWLLRLIEFGAPVMLIAVWWFVSDNSKSLYFPPLRQIVANFWHTWFFAHWASDALPTIYAILLGYAISVVVGLFVGIVLGLSPAVNEFFRPALDFFRTTPTSAAVPLLIVVIGVNIQLKIAVVMMAAVWIVIMNTTEALAGIDLTIRDTCRSYRLSPVQCLFRVYLPAASPHILTGMRVALFQSIILTIVVETLASTAGIGTYISAAQWSFHIVDMWSGILMIALISFVLTRIFHLIEHKVLTWHRGYHRRNS